MIPKRIHYCWFGGKPLPACAKRYIKTWKKQCPDYEIIRWDESNFNVDGHPFTRSAYENKAWAFVSDFARIKIVYDQGGIYLDTDVELLRNIDFLLNYDFFIGVQQWDSVCNTGLGFGASKNNEIVLDMIKQYDNRTYKDEKKKELTCPHMNDIVLKEAGYQVNDSATVIGNAIVLPPRYMDPLAPGNSRDLLCDETISIHHYSASWSSYSNRIKRTIISTVGLRNINRLKTVIKRNSDHLDKEG